MATIAFTKSYTIQSQTNGDRLWPTETAGQYTCPNAVGVWPNEEYCTFYTINSVEEFCRADALCKGFAEDPLLGFFQPTRLGFAESSRKRGKRSYLKSFVQINPSANVSIAEEPNEYTCPNVPDSIKNSTSCSFLNQTDASNYCNQDQKCHGFICSQGSCRLTQYAIVIGSATNQRNKTTESNLSVNNTIQATITTNINIKTASNLNSTLFVNMTQIIVADLPKLSLTMIILISIIPFGFVLSLIACVMYIRQNSYKRLRLEKFKDPKTGKVVDLEAFNNPVNIIQPEYTNTQISESPLSNCPTLSNNPDDTQKFDDAAIQHTEKQDPVDWTYEDVCKWLITNNASSNVMDLAKKMQIDGKKLQWLTDNDTIGYFCGSKSAAEDSLHKQIVKLFRE